MQFDKCNVSGCSKLLEMIQIGEDWDLKCKDHAITMDIQYYHSLDTMDLSYYENCIKSTKENLEKNLEDAYLKFTNKHTKRVINLESLLSKIQEKLINQIKYLKEKIQSFQRFKEVYLQLLYYLTNIQFTDREKTKTALFEMNALKHKFKLNCLKNDSLLDKYFKEIKELSTQFNIDKIPPEHHDLYQTIYKTMGPHINLDNSALSFNIISVEESGNSQMERWKITRENIKILSLKLVRNFSDISKNIIQKEIELIYQYQNLFPQIYILEERGLIGYYSVYIEPLENQLNNNFTIKDIQIFFYFLRDFMNTSVASIKVACIDPSIIGYHNKQFYILDFKYITSPKDRNYSAPEV